MFRCSSRHNFRGLPDAFSRFRMARTSSLMAALVASLPCVVVLGGLVSPLVVPTTLQAQTPLSVATAVVLDFEVAPGLDPVLGRKAADAVAVEMKSSGDFDVVSRQRVEEIVATVPGLRPPYTASTARRLGDSLGANVVIIGRVVAATVSSQIAPAVPTTTKTVANSATFGTSVPPGSNVRTARVQMELRQLEVRTGDFTNGAQPSEITTDAFDELDDDVLIDQSIDKAAYNAIRQIRLYVPNEATIMNNTATDVELNKGYRDGVRVGQRYSVMRDIYNSRRRIVERIKVAEISISRLDANQSTATLSDGGAVGVRTGDKARRIFAEGIQFTEPRTDLPASRGIKSREKSREKKRRSIQNGG